MAMQLETNSFVTPRPVALVTYDHPVAGTTVEQRGSAPPLVPIVDVSAWGGADGATNDEIAAAVDDACRTVGFMQIVGHGIPTAVIDGLAGAIDWFFALPIDEKRRSMSPRPSINRGYTPPRSERLSYSLGVVSPDDLFEAFNVGAAVSDFPHLALDPEIYAENIWPDGPGGVAYRDGVLTWMASAGRVARTMTSIFAAALGLPRGHFEPFTDHSIDVLRMNHYDVPVGVEVGAEPDGDGCPHRLRDRHGPVGRSGARPRDPAGRRQLAPHHACARGAADQPRRSDRPLVERSLALHDAPCRSTPRRRGNADPPAVGGVLPRWQRGRRDLDARTVSRRGRVEQL